MRMGIHEHLQLFKKIARRAFTWHLQAFMGIYKHIKRQSEGHSHDVLLRTQRLSRKNGKEREEDITPLFFFLMLVVYLVLDNSQYLAAWLQEQLL
jgi:hypothetical protein